MKKLMALLPVLCLGYHMMAQTIPGAKKQPQWAMPFCFEDANGEKDTVWIGYDPEASIYPDGYDPEFNEWQQIDTSVFNVVTCPDCYSPFHTLPKDSARKVAIQSYYSPSMVIGFIKGTMPVTMRWDDSLFYSARLPYADISPRPRARADFVCSNYEPPYFYCYNGHWPFVLTDYPGSEFPQRDIVHDSFYFDGSGTVSAEEAVSMRIEIVPHNYTWTGLYRPTENSIKIFPNPTSGRIYIEFASISWAYQLINSQGVVIQEGTDHFGAIEINALVKKPPGLYFLKIHTATSSQLFKVLKIGNNE